MNMSTSQKRDNFRVGFRIPAHIRKGMISAYIKHADQVLPHLHARSVTWAYRPACGFDYPREMLSVVPTCIADHRDYFALGLQVGDFTTQPSGQILRLLVACKPGVDRGAIDFDLSDEFVRPCSIEWQFAVKLERLPLRVEEPELYTPPFCERRAA
jgi:hypothetical protein